MNSDIQDCIEEFSIVLNRTSAWRRKTAAKHPDDPRNLRAAEILDQLATDSANMTDAQFEQLKPYLGWDRQIFRDWLIQSAKLVGFAHRNRNWDAFVRLPSRAETGAAKAVERIAITLSVFIMVIGFLLSATTDEEPCSFVLIDSLFWAWSGPRCGLCKQCALARGEKQFRVNKKWTHFRFVGISFTS
jgi:hypothetical protein